MVKGNQLLTEQIPEYRVALSFRKGENSYAARFVDNNFSTGDEESFHGTKILGNVKYTNTTNAAATQKKLAGGVLWLCQTLAKVGRPKNTNTNKESS